MAVWARANKGFLRTYLIVTGPHQAGLGGRLSPGFSCESGPGGLGGCKIGGRERETWGCTGSKKALGEGAGFTKGWMSASKLAYIMEFRSGNATGGRDGKQWRLSARIGNLGEAPGPAVDISTYLNTIDSTGIMNANFRWVTGVGSTAGQ